MKTIIKFFLSIWTYKANKSILFLLKDSIAAKITVIIIKFGWRYVFTFFIELYLVLDSRGSRIYFLVMKWLKGQECSNILFHFLLKSSLIFVTGFMDFILYLNCGISLTGCMDNNVVFIVIGFAFNFLNEFISLIYIFDSTSQYVFKIVFDFLIFPFDFNLLDNFGGDGFTQAPSLNLDCYNFITQDEANRLIRTTQRQYVNQLQYIKQHQPSFKSIDWPVLVRKTFLKSKFKVFNRTVSSYYVNYQMYQISFKTKQEFDAGGACIRDSLVSNDIIIKWPIYKHYVPRNADIETPFSDQPKVWRVASFRKSWRIWFNEIYIKCFNWYAFWMGKSPAPKPIYLSVRDIDLPIEYWDWYEEVYPLSFFPNGKPISLNNYQNVHDFFVPGLQVLFEVDKERVEELSKWQEINTIYSKKAVNIPYDNINDDFCVNLYWQIYNFILKERYRWSAYGTLEHYIFVNSVVALSLSEIWDEFCLDFTSNEKLRFGNKYPRDFFIRYAVGKPYASWVNTWFFYDLPRQFYSLKFAKSHGYFDGQLQHNLTREMSLFQNLYSSSWKPEQRFLYQLWQSGFNEDVSSHSYDRRYSEAAINLAKDIIKREFKKEPLYTDWLTEKIELKEATKKEVLQDYTREQKAE